MKLDPVKAIVGLGLAVVLGVPFAFRPRQTAPPADALSLIIITPHNEQIRTEFALAFSDWHRRLPPSPDNPDAGKSVRIDWRTPGGTAEIRKQLFAEYESAIRRGPIVPRTMSYDLLFGGGSYEHNLLKSVLPQSGRDTAQWTTTISAPVDFPQSQLDDWYGPNSIGRNTLYDPQHHWFGLALSAFGIVYNRDILHRLGVPEPTTWRDLTDPRLRGWVALADPGQSGSIATTYEVILQLEGWADGWRLLREAAANTRSFAASASKVPIDVSMGEAAAGMCIDFYGRTQAQSIHRGGDPDRVGYVDPPRLTDIDPDPLSLLVGAPHPELARKFIEFCLTEEAQAIWQFPRIDESSSSDSASQSESSASPPLGPRRFELRRMPIRRVMYERYFDRFLDPVNPFELARPVDSWNSDIRTFVSPLFSAMAIDNIPDLRAAWDAIQSLPVTDPRRKECLTLFHAMPSSPLSDGRIVSLESTASLPDLRARWKSDPLTRDRDRIAWTLFFRAQYRRVVDLAHEPAAPTRLPGREGAGGGLDTHPAATLATIPAELSHEP